MSEKILGYILIFVGIGVIVFSALSAYRIFTKKTQPAKLFSFPAISLDAASLGLPTAGNAKAEIIPSYVLNDSLNLFAHLFLMGFVAGIGNKLANIGTNLVRPIIVKTKEAKANG
ncbi:MAG: hypothetical protein UV74_C0013G0136 [Candidatus Woesebacteria bacterium GW2011_GWB1_43_14]|uniref:Uncharacterized protein n=1 Tax=Candidatus Woesebacteria bacterium GW2011_GWB1_43_14 TaxID=1618578 RepID=A0A0G1DH33_9BACT|nr:MAG: hypothetical protein UV51_C0005G0087 [Candidatus Woesebacteria bacterium GW2011_GWC1_42_9]KKS97014.1 MAG: hypothetical protein UV74_C0013G0136 [Candidatus Woesebacteria bacterium GW2011_GWB1_43_14]